MTVFHLLFASISMLPGVFIMAELVGPWLDSAGMGPVLGAAISLAGLLLSFILGLSLAWQVCRLFHYPPLQFMRRPCPHCKKVPPGSFIDKSHWPRLIYSCGLCGGLLELWMGRRVKVEEVSSELPSYCPRWPEFAGLWRRLTSKTTETGREH